MSLQKIVTRFAPSPTGFMHVGGIRTALFAYLFAKKNNGDFILRIEDTDKEREVEGSIEHIIESLTWLNINWDKGVGRENGDSYIQSNRLAIYREYAKKLLDAGLAYPDPYTEEEIKTFRERAIENKEPFLFRNHRPTTFDLWDGTRPLRFKTPVKRFTWNDLVRGELSAGEEALDDFIIIKSDGYPTYNFCHIVDDIEMHISHVMRGEEFIASTPKFLALYEAFQEVLPDKSITIPFFVTLPPILGETGTKKLGKRDGAKDVLEYRTEGYLPDALINYLALQGWNPGTEQEYFLESDLIESFSIEKIQKSGARWNEDKLLFINKEHLKKLDSETLCIYVKSFIPEKVLNLDGYTDEKLKSALNLIVDRIQVGKEITELFDSGDLVYLFEDPNGYDSELLLWKKDLNRENTERRLILTKSVLENLSDSLFQDDESLKENLLPLADKEGRGEVLWPLRTALSGLTKSTDPFTIMSLIGKESTLRRIDRALLYLKS